MQFIFPAFLFALLSLAIPVIIHLFYFRRFKKVYFSDIRFLKEVQEEKSTIEKLKKRLILATRLLALFFLVLAFVQPFLGQEDKKNAQGRSSVCVYIDNSWSMGLKTGGETALSTAKSKAKELAGAFAAGDQFCLLTNDMQHSRQRWMGKADFLDAVERVELVGNNRTVAEIYQKQHALFQTIGTGNKLGFFISDFQDNMAVAASDTTFTAHFLPVQGDAEKNLFVDTCWFENPVFSLNAGNKLLVRIRNSGNTDAEKIRVSVKINGQVKSVDDVSIPAQSMVLDSFNFSITQTGWQQGEVVFNDYPITFDDHFYFVFRVDEKEQVLNITDASSPNNITAVFRDDIHFRLNQAGKGQLDYSAFNNYALIVLNQLSEISSGLAASLGAYLDNGGNLYIIPGTTINLDGYNAFLMKYAGTGFSALQKQAGVVTQLQTRERVFKGVFNQLPKNLDLPKISQFYPFRGGANSAERPLLSTNTGTPLLSVFDAGNGLLYLQAAPLNADFTDLGTKAVFPPVVYNMAVYKKYSRPMYYTIGKDNLVELKGESADGETIYNLSNGRSEFIPENRSIGNSVVLRVNQDLESDGIYTIRSGQTDKGAAAFNYDRSESTLKFKDKTALAALYSDKNQLLLDNSSANLAASVKQIKEGIILWKLCLILCLVFILSEVLLIRFMK
jgi:hypothetical protein